MKIKKRTKRNIVVYAWLCVGVALMTIGFLCFIGAVGCFMESNLTIPFAATGLVGMIVGPRMCIAASKYVRC